MPETSASPGQSPTLGPAPLGPTAPTERIEVLDILRGFALLGVLLMHIEYFVSPSYHAVMETQGPAGLVNMFVIWLVRFLVESKFFCLFAFLFGYGMGLQMARAEARQARFVPLYARRLTVLLLIGAYHGVLLWAFEILLTYALVGFVLLLFRNRSNKTLVITACCCLLLQVLLVAAMCWDGLAPSEPQAAAEIEAEYDASSAEAQAWEQQALQIYARGTVADIMARRFMDWQFGVFYSLAGAPMVLAMFLLGLYASRRKLLSKPPALPGAFRNMLLIGLTVGLLGNLAYVAVMEDVDLTRPSWSWIWSTAIVVVAAPALSAFYLAGIVTLLRRPRCHRILAPLAAVGRTALSNYLLQSVICTTVCCSYGLGLYGRIKPPVGIVLAVFIYLLQVWLSVWWLRRFRFGPAEWLWRWLTYRRRPPMRARPSLSPGGSGDARAV